MNPIHMHPDLPEPTNTFGKPVAKSQWYECPHCKQSSPLSREWVSLTDDEMGELYDKTIIADIKDYAKAIEAKLKEKNT